MFYLKRIKELKAEVADLEVRVHELAHSVHQQSDDIDKLYAMFANQAAVNAQKPKPKYRPKKNGKETPKASE